MSKCCRTCWRSASHSPRCSPARCRSPARRLARGSLTIVRGAQNQVTIETRDELSPLLGWLATLPLAEVQIEPLGLQSVYDQLYPAVAS